MTGWVEVVRCPGCLEIVDQTPPPTLFGFRYLPYSAGLRKPR